MTEKLYWNDAYAKEFSAKITKINGNEVVLDKTLFYQQAVVSQMILEKSPAMEMSIR